MSIGVPSLVFSHCIVLSSIILCGFGVCIVSSWASFFTDNASICADISHVTSLFVCIEMSAECCALCYAPAGKFSASCFCLVAPRVQGHYVQVSLTCMDTQFVACAHLVIAAFAADFERA